MNGVNSNKLSEKKLRRSEAFLILLISLFLIICTWSFICGTVSWWVSGAVFSAVLTVHWILAGSFVWAVIFVVFIFIIFCHWNSPPDSIYKETAVHTATSVTDFIISQDQKFIHFLWMNRENPGRGATGVFKGSINN